MSDSFCHLHQHTEYSMLDGAARVGELLDAVVADGQPACGITDHGVMYGVLDFYKACIKRDLKPVIGFEAYMAQESRTERPKRGKAEADDSGGETSDGKKINYHLTLLAENNEGYKNLIQLSSRAFMEGYYYKPRIDWELLEQHHEGVIATTGCLGGQVLQALLRKDQQGAVQIAGRLQDIFGKDNLFVEIQDHDIPAQRKTYQQLIDVAKAIDAPLVATNDGHYVHQEDALAHDALLCVQTRTALADKDRFKFESDQHYLKSAEEMRYLFRELPSSCDNTLLIAERAQLEIPFGELHLPDFPVPPGFADADAYLADLVLKGAAKRWNITDDIISRLVYELKVIQDMGFASYFLIVWDLIEHAKKSGIRTGPGRGSAAGSAVSYSLGITEIDPIEHGLLFERFLNPSRISMPDIDMDIDTRYRDEMIRYCADKYGRDHVAQIVTFGTIKARAAVRDAARVLGFKFTLSDDISKALPPPVQGRDAPLKACFELTEDYEWAYPKAQGLRDLYAANPDVQTVMKVALGLEGLRRQDGIHAAAVVVSDKPLTDYLPIQRKEESAPIVTQYEMHGVEDLGLLKMDFLGLRNLDVISECLRMLVEAGFDVGDINQIPLDDRKTYELLQRGETVGIFQLESTGMQQLLMRLRPTTFADVGACVALYRPGPMGDNMHNDYADRKNRRQSVAYYHDDATELLQDTYGLMIYQEQVMRMAQKFAGYSLAEADNLRKAMGKKVRELMAAEHDKFVQGCVAQGYDESLGVRLFGMIESFADYAFNKSHAYGYGLIAYQTAYLKANFPTYYMAALCSAAKNIEDQTIALSEARRMGIELRLPSVNYSQTDFSATPTAIRVGLSSVKDVGSAFGDEVVAERTENGPFLDVFDFVFRMKVRGVRAMTTRSFQTLAKGGAFDEYGQSRMGLIAVRDEILKGATRQKEKAAKGQTTLFDLKRSYEVPETEYSRVELLELEKAVLGVYVSGHPMDGVDLEELKEWSHKTVDVALHQLADQEDETTCWTAGVVTLINRSKTRAGEDMARLQVESQYGAVEFIAFPKNWGKVASFMETGRVYVFRTRVTASNHGERLYTLIEAIATPKDESNVPVEGTDFKIFLPAGFQQDDKALSRLKGLLLTHRGPTPVALHLSKNTSAKLPDEYGVTESPALIEALRDLFKPQ